MASYDPLTVYDHFVTSSRTNATGLSKLLLFFVFFSFLKSMYLQYAVLTSNLATGVF